MKKLSILLWALAVAALAALPVLMHGASTFRSATFLGSLTTGAAQQGGGGEPGGVNLTNGLVAYWKLDSVSGANVWDDAVGTNDLTSAGSANVQSGKVGNAANLLNNDRLVALDAPEVRFGGESWTIAMWFLNTYEGGLGELFGKYGEAGQREILCILQDNAAVSDVHFYDNTDAGASASTTGVSYIDSAWHFLVVWRANDTLFMQFDNGTSNSVSVASLGTTGSTSPLIVGGQWDVYYWIGKIDEVGKWNRALNADERTALWNEGNGMTLP